jgi:hypothetical protein
MIWRRRYDKIQINRKEYRIEFNWNALTTFMESVGMNFGDIDNFEKLNAEQFIKLIYEGVREGTRLQKKEFPYSVEDFIAMLTPEAVESFSLIFQAQNIKSLSELKKKV